jgi:predicted O-methyltransferase YrrM
MRDTETVAAAPEKNRKPLSAAEFTLELFAQDAGDPDTRQHRISRGGSGTCAFLQHIFPGGLPSGFGAAEVGVWHGDTSLKLAKLLPEDGFLHIFDYEAIARSVAQRLAEEGCKNVRAFGSSTKSRDSYNWSLMRLMIGNPTPIYDYVFLDGAHSWDIDGLAFFLLDRLLKPGGFLDFDDYGWTMATSPSLNPQVNPDTLQWFTEEQINVSHIMLVVELLVKRDHRYREIVKNKIYRKTCL